MIRINISAKERQAKQLKHLRDECRALGIDYNLSLYLRPKISDYIAFKMKEIKEFKNVERN